MTVKLTVKCNIQHIVVYMLVLVLLLFAAAESAAFDFGSSLNCRFDFRTSIISQHFVDNRTKCLQNLPRIAWSHLKSDFYRILQPQTADFVLPIYPTNVIAELKFAYINLIAGAIYNGSGCTADHLSDSYDWYRRQKFISKSLNLQSLIDRNSFDFERAIFLWGSIYSSDWQHAVIDFLPLFNYALHLVQRIALENKSAVVDGRFTIPIICGSYIKFFEKDFPFNLFTFIHRNFKHKYMPTPIAVEPMSFRQVFVVDILHREQSNLLPDSYRSVIPFLSPDFHYQPSLHNFSFLMKHLAMEDRRLGCNKSTLHNTSAKISDRNLVVFLDRNTIANDETYRRKVGQTNGRQLLNQSALLAAINSSLRSPYQLKVHSCMDWRTDRLVISRAVVLIGVHGGHFSNMIFAPRGTHVVEIGRSLLMRVLQSRGLPMDGNNGSEERRRSRFSYQGRKQHKNPRMVFSGMAASLGHVYWAVEDLMAVKAVLAAQWEDEPNLTQSQSLTETGKSKSRTNKEKNKNNNKKKRTKPPGWSPDWSDGPVSVDITQVIDTLVTIGVAVKSTNREAKRQQKQAA